MRRNVRTLATGLVGAVLGTALIATGAATAQAASYPVINEFSVNTTGNDVEYIEVYAPGMDLTGYQLLQVEGDVSSAPRGTVITADAVPTANVEGFSILNLPRDRYQNGTLTILLVTGYDASMANIDPEKDGTLLDPLPFTIVDSVAVNDGGAGDLTYGPTLGPVYDGLPLTPGGGSRIPDGADTDAAADWMRNDFDLYGIDGYAGSPVEGEAINTPGLPNAAYEVVDPGGSCDIDVTPIGAVQGSGDASPLVGTQVSVQGVVTGDFQTGGFGGFTVQDAGDADAATSDAIWAYGTGVDVSVGQIVHVTGEVLEYGGLTEITAAGIVVCGDGTVPAPVDMSLPLQSPESFESMLVRFADPLVISEYFNFARYGQIMLTTAPQYQPTAIFEPGSAEAVALAAENLANRIMLDDGVGAQNPDPARHPNGSPFTLDNIFRGGDTLTNVVGVLDWRANSSSDPASWRIQPTAAADYTATSDRPELPQVAGELHVASFNVLNYFTTLGDRGANDQEEFDRQQAKIVAAILAIDADVVGLLEIENNGTAVEALVQALNTAAGETRYAAIVTGVLGTDAITTAIIYQPASVTPSGAFAVLDESVDPRFNTDRNRPALAQAFMDNATSELFQVVVNHLKSKGSSCSADGDPLDPNGQGECNVTRTQAVLAMVDWLATDPLGIGVDHSLVLGDMNAYQQEDPIQAFLAAGYVDLATEFEGPESYSYVFDGMLGHLDYVFASPGMVDLVTGTATWNINAPEVSILDYDTTFKLPAQDAIFAPDEYRSSDHDPVIVGLTFVQQPGEPDVITYSGEDRYETAAAVSAGTIAEGSPVVIASGQDFADALSAGPAAAHLDAALLLTTATVLPQATIDEIERIGPDRVIIVGGVGAVSAQVAAQLQALTGVTPERIAGADRFETSAAVATELIGSADQAFLANGLDYPDALAAASLGAALGGQPVLLSLPTVLPESVADAIVELGADNVVLIGGRAVLSTTVLGEVAELTRATRVGGADRFETNTLLMTRYLDPTDPQTIIMATGMNYPDALTSAVVAAASGGPLLLSMQTCVMPTTVDAIAFYDPDTVVNVGGAGSISPVAWQNPC